MIVSSLSHPIVHHRDKCSLAMVHSPCKVIWTNWMLQNLFQAVVQFYSPDRDFCWQSLVGQPCRCFGGWRWRRFVAIIEGGINIPWIQSKQSTHEQTRMLTKSSKAETLGWDDSWKKNTGNCYSIQVSFCTIFSWIWRFVPERSIDKSAAFLMEVWFEMLWFAAHSALRAWLGGG